MKKFIKVILKIILVLFVSFIFMFIGGVENLTLAIGMKYQGIFSFIMFVFLLSFLYPIFSKFLPQNNFFKKFSIYIGGLVVLALVVNQVNGSIKQLKGKERFNYVYGSCVPLMDAFYQGKVPQSIYKGLISPLNYSFQYIIHTANEACRVFDIKTALETTGSLCSESKVDCLIEINENIRKTSRYSSTGGILMIAVAALNVFNEKKELETVVEKIKDEKYRKKEKFKVLTHSALRLIETLEGITPNDKPFARPSDFINSFPTEDDYRIFSKEERNQLDKISLEIEKNKEANIDQFIKIMGFKEFDGFGTANRRSLVEAYLLEKVDGIIIKKYQEVSNDKLGSLKSDIVKKLYENKDLLTTQEFESFKNRIENIEE